MENRNFYSDMLNALHETEETVCRPEAAPVFELNPLLDERWVEFVRGSKESTIFHTREWLRALHQTFGYEPVVFTTSAPGNELKDGIPFCRVKSWLTGNRMVALPFSDHCQPLGSPRDVIGLLNGLAMSPASDLKYVEVRPIDANLPSSFHKSEMFWLHRLDLRPELPELFGALHKSSIQRTIRRAERAGLQIESGRSEWHLQEFYKLFVLTRRRFQIPPHPLQWLRNLLTSLDTKIKISVALDRGKAIAAMVTLNHKNVVTYKYGASDARFHSLGAVSLLFWTAICGAKADGATEFDFGRTALDNSGLITFKSRWGTGASELAYWRFGKLHHHRWESRPVIDCLKRCLSYLPDRVFEGIGNKLYRHIG